MSGLQGNSNETRKPIWKTVTLCHISSILFLSQGVSGSELDVLEHLDAPRRRVMDALAEAKNATKAATVEEVDASNQKLKAPAP